MKICKKIIIILFIFSLTIVPGTNIVISNKLNYFSDIYLNNPPKIINSLSYYDKYNDILYVAAMDPDSDKICVGIDWDKDKNIDEWSTYRRIQTRWEFDCIGRTGLVYFFAEDEHGARSEWHDIMYKIKDINLNSFLSLFFLNHFPFLQTYLSNFL